MKTSNFFYYVFLMLLLLLFQIGCSGSSDNKKEVSSPGSASNLDTSTTPSTLVSAENFRIDLSKVSGYETGASKEDRFLSVVNYIRTLAIKCNDTSGLSGPVNVALLWNGLLNEAAQEHSDDMLATRTFSHSGSGTNSDVTGQTFSPVRASTPFERMRYHDYNYVTAAENIASRSTYPKLSDASWVKAFEGWVTSKTGHCSNIMNPKFRDFGMAESLGKKNIRFDDGVTRAADVAYWTQKFGRQ